MITTFNLIIKNLLKLDNHIFSLNYNKSDKINGMFKLYFNMLLYDNYKLDNNKKFFRNKFHFLDYVLNNFYFTKNKEYIDEFFGYFCLIQKYYKCLNKLVYNYKYKKAKLIVNTDLQLNELQSNQKNVICIYQNDGKYLFKIDDILKLIYTALTNTYMLFNEPLIIKNPYNNVPFSKSILYQIYFFLINKCDLNYLKFKHIDLFLKFYKLNFNLSSFLNNYEHILRDYSIDNYLNNANEIELKEEIYIMIKIYNEKQHKLKDYIIIDEGFPIKRLITIMKPYLHLKILSNYSLIPNIRRQSYLLLFNKLKEFHIHNPNFGRKRFIFKSLKDLSNNEKYKYNDIHKKFINYEEENFLTNHLSYKYNNYDDYSNNTNDNIEYNTISNNNYSINDNIQQETIYRDNTYNFDISNNLYNNLEQHNSYYDSYDNINGEQINYDETINFINNNTELNSSNNSVETYGDYEDDNEYKTNV